MIEIQPEIIFESKYQGAFIESLRFDGCGRLYFVDKKDSLFGRISMRNEEYWRIPFEPSSIAPIDEDSGFLFGSHSAFRYTLSPFSISLIATVPDMDDDEVFNDSLVVADRIFITTMDVSERREIGGLYCLLGNEFFRPIRNKLIVGNGLVEHNHSLFIADSGADKLYRYGYSRRGSPLSLVEDFKNRLQGPDGIAKIDCNRIVIPAFFSGDVFIYDIRSGVIESRYILPTSTATSAAICNGSSFCINSNLIFVGTTRNHPDNRLEGRIIGFQYVH